MSEEAWLEPEAGFDATGAAETSTTVIENIAQRLWKAAEESDIEVELYFYLGSLPGAGADPPISIEVRSASGSVFFVQDSRDCFWMSIIQSQSDIGPTCPIEADASFDPLLARGMAALTRGSKLCGLDRIHPAFN